MKFILILVAMNMANPAEESLLAHQVFATQALCMTAIEQLPAINFPIRAAAFCVSEKDLLEE